MGLFLHTCNQLCLFCLSAQFRQHVKHPSVQCLSCHTPRPSLGAREKGYGTGYLQCQRRKALLPSKHCLEKGWAKGGQQCSGRTETQRCSQIPKQNAKWGMIPDGCGDSVVTLTKRRGSTELGMVRAEVLPNQEPGLPPPVPAPAQGAPSSLMQAGHNGAVFQPLAA